MRRSRWSGRPAAASATCADLARRLGRVAATLDAELRLLAREPDPAELARVLPAARARVADVARVGLTIRRAASAGLGADTAASSPPSKPRSSARSWPWTPGSTASSPSPPAPEAPPPAPAV